MNKLHLLIISGFILFNISALSQTDLQLKNTELLQGTWLIDTVYIDFELSEEMMAFYSEKFKEIKSTTRFVFHSDGRYEKISKDAPRKGKWEVVDNGNVILIHFDGLEEVSRTKIGKLDHTSLSMIPLDKTAQNSKVELIRQKNE
jgi:hypothetical protein